MDLFEKIQFGIFAVLYGILSLNYILATMMAVRHYVHMFQLNSYKPKVQIKWIWQNSRNQLFVNLAMVALCALLWASGGMIHFAAEMCIFFAIMVHILKPKKAFKTPLVYTNRVKRMLLTTAVICLIPFVLLINAEKTLIALPTAFALTYLLVPFVILLANLINRPIELMINRHYINDAKRILEGCRSHLKVIGITGSFGKTSVKYFLETLLSVKYNVLKTPGNFNTPLGVVKTIRGSLRATHDVFLCEMGAKNVGDIKEICDIVHPDMGIITSVGPMHLESFKSIENVIKTKFELADAVSEKGGEVYANFDNEYIVGECKKREVIPYGIDDVSGYTVSNLHISELGSEFRVTSPEGESCEYRTRLIGRHNVLNIVGAIAVAHRLGISLDELRPAVRKLESVPHRLQLIDKGEYTIIDDAYNSNPSGTKAALETLSMTDGMKILVTPGMVELGGMEYALNKEFGVDAAKVCDFVALVGKKQTQPIYDGLKSADYPEEKIYVAESLNDAMAKVYGLTSGGKRKIILLENDLPDNY